MIRVVGPVAPMPWFKVAEILIARVRLSVFLSETLTLLITSCAVPPAHVQRFVRFRVLCTERSVPGHSEEEIIEIAVTLVIAIATGRYRRIISLDEFALDVISVFIHSRCIKIKRGTV